MQKEQCIRIGNVEPNTLYTVQETAEILRCKVNTIYTWTYQKRLEAIKSGSKSLFLGANILDFLGINRNIVLDFKDNNIYNISTRNHTSKELLA